jgi:hypothetical protein
LSREISIYDDSSDSTKISYLVQEVDKITSVISELAATDSQQLKAAIALLQRWISAVDGNWQISEITDDTRDFLEQRAAV